MKHYVYKIVNSNNEIEYIGETKNPDTRLRNHTCKNGNFANRKYLSLEIIKECKGKKSAFKSKK
jgi:predicted GIY-YIG superfamily endonuclease